MATIIINGQEHTLPEGEKLNAIQMAKRVGVDIPYYCWHPALSVVANCRMCEIEVGSKDPKTGEIKMIPKLVPGCQTPAKDGTVLVTDSPKVKEHQRMIMEYLLINHPLDCPVCDQAGECGLQDYSYEYGQSIHRFVEERTVNPRKDVSDLIQLNQDRCIMCTRCVRFTREITQTGELQVMRRGNHAEIDIFPGHPVDNPLAGNVVDLCPVGALLDKDFLHKQRVWFLSKHDAICTRCSTGCNISAEENRGELWRFKPRHNPHVNDYWICDEGRYSYKAANDPALLSAMYVRKNGDLAAGRRSTRRSRPSVEASQEIASAAAIVAGVLSPFLTVEEAYLLASLPEGAEPGERAGARAGPGPRATTRPSRPTRPRAGPATPASSSRGRSRSTPRSARTAGASRPSSSTSRARSSTTTRLVGGSPPASSRRLYVASDAIDPWIDEAQAEALRAGVEVPGRPGHERHAAGPTGRRGARRSDVRREGGLLRQRRRPAPVRRGVAAAARRLAARPRPVRDPARPRRRPGPIRARSWPSWPSAIPAFGVAEGGKLPPFGVPSGRGRAGRPPAAAGSTIPGSRSQGRGAATMSRRPAQGSRSTVSMHRIGSASRGIDVHAGADRHPVQDPDRGGRHPGGGRLPDPGRAEGRGLRAGPDRAEPRRREFGIPFGLLQPLADGAKMLLKEDVVPDYVNKPLFILAPDDRDHRGHDRLRRRAVRAGRARRRPGDTGSTSRSRRASTSASSTSSRSAAWRSTA